MNYPKAPQSLSAGTRYQLAPRINETKQGSGAAQRLHNQSSLMVSFTGNSKWTYVFYGAMRVE